VLNRIVIAATTMATDVAAIVGHSPWWVIVAVLFAASSQST